MPKSDQGVSKNRYQLIPRTLIFLTKGDEVLLLKGAPTKRIWANLYNGIGGHVERGEDVLTAAERELAEETGLVSSGLSLCATLIVDASEEAGVGIYVFKGEYESGTLAPSAEGLLEWRRIEDLAGLPLVEDLAVLLPKILAIKPGEPPISARSYYDQQEKLQVVFKS